MPFLGLGRKDKHQAIGQVHGRDAGYAEGYMYGYCDGALSEEGHAELTPSPRTAQRVDSGARQNLVNIAGPIQYTSTVQQQHVVNIDGPIQYTSTVERRDTIEMTRPLRSSVSFARRNDTEIPRPIQPTGAAERSNGVEFTRPFLRQSLLGLERRNLGEDVIEGLGRRVETPPLPVYVRISDEPSTGISNGETFITSPRSSPPSYHSRYSSQTAASSAPSTPSHRSEYSPRDSRSSVPTTPSRRSRNLTRPPGSSIPSTPSHHSTHSSQPAGSSTTPTPPAYDRNPNTSRVRFDDAAQGPHSREPTPYIPFENPRPAPRPPPLHLSTRTLSRPSESKPHDSSLRVRIVSFFHSFAYAKESKKRDSGVAMTNKPLEDEEDRANLHGRYWDKHDVRDGWWFS